MLIIITCFVICVLKNLTYLFCFAFDWAYFSRFTFSLVFILFLLLTMLS